MQEMQYSEAAVEVLDILNYTNKEDVQKIPQSFIKFLMDISSKTYKSNLNHELPISGLNLKEQTKELLGFMYITWWCSKDEQEEYKKQIHNNNMKKEQVKEIYNSTDIFKNKKQSRVNQITQNENAIEANITQYKEKNILKRFLNKILNIFSR